MDTGFAIGDIVQLKSGGPWMTVHKVGVKNGYVEVVLCVTNTGTVNIAQLHPAVLTLIKAAAPVPESTKE